MSIDNAKWHPNWFGADDAAITRPVNATNEAACYDPAQATESAGLASLTAVERPCVTDQGVPFSYATGFLSSYGLYSFTFGYAEARIYVPGVITPDNWAQFWLAGLGEWPTTGEIDIMEALSADCWHFHYGSVLDPQQVGGCPAGYGAGWHTFGVRWLAGSITWFYDGHQVGQVTHDVTNSPMFVVAGYGIAGTFGPIVTPSTMLVDYVRIWQ